MLKLAERLAGLADDQWNAPSLCTEWRIRDVLAHLTAGAEGAFGVGAIFWGMFRHGCRYTRWVAADGQARGQQDPAVILKALRNAAANRNDPPGGGSVRGLAQILIHGQDIFVTFGINR